jgi:hypothetical protein
VLVIARDGREDELARALAALGECLDFAVDHTGFEVVAVMEGDNGEGAREAGT